MKCKEKEWLLSEYQRARDHCAASMTELYQNLETSSPEAYESLQQRTDEARVHSERALLALEAHLGMHSC